METDREARRRARRERIAIAHHRQKAAAASAKRRAVEPDKRLSADIGLFEKLPGELRSLIYEFTLVQPCYIRMVYNLKHLTFDCNEHHPSDHRHDMTGLALTRVSYRLRLEVMPSFYAANDFVVRFSRTFHEDGCSKWWTKGYDEDMEEFRWMLSYIHAEDQSKMHGLIMDFGTWDLGAAGMEEIEDPFDLEEIVENGGRLAPSVFFDLRRIYKVPNDRCFMFVNLNWVSPSRIAGWDYRQWMLLLCNEDSRETDYGQMSLLLPLASRDGYEDAAFMVDEEIDWLHERMDAHKAHEDCVMVGILDQLHDQLDEVWESLQKMVARWYGVDMKDYYDI